MAQKAPKKGRTTTIRVYTEDYLRLREIARSKHISIAEALRQVLSRRFMVKAKMWRLYGSYAHKGQHHPGDFSPPVDVEVTVITRRNVVEATVVRAARIAIRRSLEELNKAGITDIKEFSADGQDTFEIGEVIDVEVESDAITPVSELVNEILRQLLGQLL